MDTPEHERRPFYLYADEFQNDASNGFAVILSEARKYALSPTLGHQYLGQLPENLRQAVLGNAASFIAFRVGAEDAPLLAAHLSLKPEVETSGMGMRSTEPVEQLVRLPDVHATARTLVDETPTEATFLEMLPPPKPVNHRPHRLITNSRARFGRERRTVEERSRASWRELEPLSSPQHPAWTRGEPALHFWPLDSSAHLV